MKSAFPCIIPHSVETSEKGLVAEKTDIKMDKVNLSSRFCTKGLRCFIQWYGALRLTSLPPSSPISAGKQHDREMRRGGQAMAAYGCKTPRWWACRQERKIWKTRKKNPLAYRTLPFAETCVKLFESLSHKKQQPWQPWLIWINNRLESCYQQRNHTEVTEDTPKLSGFSKKKR